MDKLNTDSASCASSCCPDFEQNLLINTSFVDVDILSDSSAALTMVPAQELLLPLHATAFPTDTQS